MVPAFEIGLVFVSGEDLHVGEVTVVADQRKAAIAGRVIADVMSAATLKRLVATDVLRVSPTPPREKVLGSLSLMDT